MLTMQHELVFQVLFNHIEGI